MTQSIYCRKLAVMLIRLKVRSVGGDKIVCSTVVFAHGWVILNTLTDVDGEFQRKGTIRTYKASDTEK